MFSAIEPSDSQLRAAPAFHFASTSHPKQVRRFDRPALNHLYGESLRQVIYYNSQQDPQSREFNITVIKRIYDITKTLSAFPLHVYGVGCKI